MSSNEQKSPIFIIAGMHRSGTSLTASLLQSWGVNIGNKLVGPNYGNVKGHFENVDFVEFHKAVLKSNGIDQLGCTLQDKILIKDANLKQAQDLIQSDQVPNSPWGWKDPRTTLFLEFWKNLLPQAYFIFVYRSPWEVVDSLYRRATDERLLDDPKFAVEMWIQYNRKILEFYQAYPQQCILINVYTVGNRPEDFYQEISDKFGVTLTEIDQENKFEPSLLLNDIFKTEKPYLIKEYFPEAIALYQELEETAQNLSSKMIETELEALNQSIPNDWVFQDWSELRRLEKDYSLLKESSEHWQSQFEDAVERLMKTESELGKTQFKFNATDIKLQEALTKLVEIEKNLGETQGLLEGTQQQLQGMILHAENLEESLKNSQNRFQEAVDKLVKTELELGQAQSTIIRLDAKYQESLFKLISTETEYGKLQFQFQDLEIHYQESIAKLIATEEELGRTQLRALEMETKFQEALTKIYSLENRLGEAEGEIEAMKTSKFWKLRGKWFGFKRLVRRVRPRWISSIDSPSSWEMQGFTEYYLNIEGWCFNTGKRTGKAMRARIGNEIFEGISGIEREDVAETFSAPLKSGFYVQVRVRPGRYPLHLEIQDSQGKWTRFATYPMSVSPLAASFDLPTSFEQRQGQIFFAGWCCHPQHRIIKLKLSCGNISVNCAHGMRRMDVGEVFPTWAGSAESGFECLMDLPVGTWNLKLEAELETGEIVTLEHSQPLQVSRYGLLEKSSVKLKQIPRFVAAVRKRAGERKQRLGRIVPMPWEIPAVLRQMRTMYRQTQSPVGEFLLPQGFELLQPVDPYEAWLTANQWTERALDSLRTRINSYPPEKLPKISVVMPVFNPPIEFLEQAIASVVNQVYSNWELCIADDCSTDPNVAEILNKWAAEDSRIHVIFRPENGNISAATNTAAEQATGEFLIFLDNDDELTLNALGEVAIYLVEHPNTDVLYSDDDKIDTEGKRFAPQFKPDWSPQLLLSYMYMGHLFVVRRQIFEQLNGFRLGFEGSQDYDFALRATEIARQVAHIPLVLYHWRTAPGSTAVSGAAKPASFDAGKRGIQEALTRRQSSGIVYQPKWASELNLGIFSHRFPDNGPSVAIIIPTKNQLKLLKACIDSLKKTSYENYQIVIIDNESDDPQTLDYLNEISHTQTSPKITVLRIVNNGKFNFAAINNRAVEQVESDYVLFLNNDTEIINSEWLSQMMGYAQMSDVGAVGARLIYPNDRIQHAGIIHGLHHGLAGHAFKLTLRQEFGYLAYSRVVRNYSAVTAACLLTPRNLFLELGAFNETDFAVAYNDADYGYRLFEKGYQSVYCPDAELIHREGTTRGYKDNPQEVATFRRQYADKIDPFYNPHLSLANEWFQIQPRRYVFQIPPDLLPKPKVLMCSNALEYTGAPLHQFEIAVKLATEGKIEPVIFCLSDGLLRQAYEEQGIQVIVQEFPLMNSYQRDSYDTAIQTLGQTLELQQYDVVYANTLENFFMVDCAHQMGVPCIWNVHESEPWQSYFDRFGSQIAARALECFRFPYRIIFVADATRNQYLPLNSHHNFTVIHNGLDIERLQESAEQWTKSSARSSLNLNDQEIVILLLGTVCERKGQHDLAKALPFLPAQWHQQIRCFIVGSRSNLYDTELKNLVENLPETLRERVTIVPETPETAKYYKAADIFVCTSRIESYPRVILEAMGYGLPIVTTPVFGIAEQVRPEINGLFYSPNQPEELAQNLTRLLQDEEFRQQLADNSQYVLQSLNTFEEMTQGYLEIFQEAYFINPNSQVGLPALPEEVPPPIPEASESSEPAITSQDKSYWEMNPTAATASQWVANPIIADVIHRRMSGGKTKKYWLRWLIEDYFAGKNFESLISLGCGIGNHEILMAELGFAREIDAFDFSEASLEIARRDAAATGVNVNFYQDDFNNFTLNPEKRYDVAFCSGSLHHVRELERFLETVHKCLRPQGYFILNEYVGDSYCIYDQRQVDIIDRLYQCFHQLTRSGIREEFINPTIRQVFATDPSEAVRSKLILPFLEFYFDVEVYNPFGGGILHPMYPLLNHHQFLPGDPKGETIIRLLLEFEQILMEIPGGLESDFCLCVLRPKLF